MGFKPGSREVEWSRSKEKNPVSSLRMWLLNMNHLLYLVIERQREKWFIYIYSDDILVASVTC